MLKVTGAARVSSVVGFKHDDFKATALDCWNLPHPVQPCRFGRRCVSGLPGKWQLDLERILHWRSWRIRMRGSAAVHSVAIAAILFPPLSMATTKPNKDHFSGRRMARPVCICCSAARRR